MKYNTLREFFTQSSNGLKVGDFIQFEDGTNLLIGDATEYHEPSQSDGGIGWDWDGALSNKKILLAFNVFTDKKIMEEE